MCTRFKLKSSFSCKSNRGYNVNFNKFGALVYKEPGDIKMTAVRIKNAYCVSFFLVNERAAAASTEEDIWHKRMGHAHKEITNQMKRENLVLGMTCDWKNECKSCIEGKVCKKSH